MLLHVTQLLLLQPQAAGARCGSRAKAAQAGPHPHKLNQNPVLINMSQSAVIFRPSLDPSFSPSPRVVISRLLGHSRPLCQASLWQPRCCSSPSACLTFVPTAAQLPARCCRPCHSRNRAACACAWAGLYSRMCPGGRTRPRVQEARRLPPQSHACTNKNTSNPCPTLHIPRPRIFTLACTPPLPRISQVGGPLRRPHHHQLQRLPLLNALRYGVHFAPGGGGRGGGGGSWGSWGANGGGRRRGAGPGGVRPPVIKG
jgi:hypothetical protein